MEILKDNTNECLYYLVKCNVCSSDLKVSEYEFKTNADGHTYIHCPCCRKRNYMSTQQLQNLTKI